MIFSWFTTVSIDYRLQSIQRLEITYIFPFNPISCKHKIRLLSCESYPLSRKKYISVNIIHFQCNIILWALVKIKMDFFRLANLRCCSIVLFFSVWPPPRTCTIMFQEPTEPLSPFSLFSPSSMFILPTWTTGTTGDNGARAYLFGRMIIINNNNI